MMQMPSAAMPVKNNRPGEKPQCNQEKSAEINQGLRNAGTGGYQRPKRILFIHPECTGQKTCSNHNKKTACPAERLCLWSCRSSDAASRKPELGANFNRAAIWVRLKLLRSSRAWSRFLPII